jgi:hypothetical protein
MPTTSSGASNSPKASQPTVAAMAGWVSSAIPMISGGKWRSEKTSKPCPTRWLRSASTSTGVHPASPGHTGSPAACGLAR